MKFNNKQKINFLRDFQGNLYYQKSRLEAGQITASQAKYFLMKIILSDTLGNKKLEACGMSLDPEVLGIFHSTAGVIRLYNSGIHEIDKQVKQFKDVVPDKK